MCRVTTLDRRTMLQTAGAAVAAALAPWPGFAREPGPGITPDEALARLQEGNAAFMADQPQPRAEGHERRLEIARGQRPFAILVGCSDSRVPPELLFGRGLGELFIVRNAGNTVDTAAMGSVEYGVVELGVPLIVVLGHERCGAVAAAVDVVERNATFPGSIGGMIEPIVPAVLRAKSELGAGSGLDALVDASVHANVQRVTNRLRTSEALLLEPLKAGRLKVVGAYYHLDSGKVDFFDQA